MNHDVINKLRTVMIELLDEFARICEDNNLTYFLTAGTLLWAIRHKGFIPWDDDMDVAMPRIDYEKFIDIFNNITEGNYYLLSYKSQDKAAIHCKHFAKLCKKGTVFAEAYKASDSYPGIYIDIFPIDNCFLFFVPIQTALIRIARKVYRMKIKSAVFKNRFQLFFCKLLCCFFSKKSIDIIHRKLHVIFKNCNTKYVSSFGGRYHYRKETHRYDSIFPLTKVLFEGKYYYAPNNYDLFLKTLYGNYMELPPVAEQRGIHEPLFIQFDDSDTYFPDAGSTE